MRSSGKGMRIGGVELNLDAICTCTYSLETDSSEIVMVTGFVIKASGDWRKKIKEFRLNHFTWTDGKTFESRR